MKISILYFYSFSAIKVPWNPLKCLFIHFSAILLSNACLARCGLLFTSSLLFCHTLFPPSVLGADHWWPCGSSSCTYNYRISFIGLPSYLYLPSSGFQVNLWRFSMALKCAFTLFNSTGSPPTNFISSLHLQRPFMFSHSWSFWIIL